jgi:hypothetical protein
LQALLQDLPDDFRARHQGPDGELRRLRVLYPIGLQQDPPEGALGKAGADEIPDRKMGALIPPEKVIRHPAWIRGRGMGRKAVGWACLRFGIPR